jgi:hypothetical protein
MPFRACTSSTLTSTEEASHSPAFVLATSTMAGEQSVAVSLVPFG